MRKELANPVILSLALLLISFSSSANDAHWIDVRSPGEYEKGHVGNAINIPHTEITQRISEVTSNLDARLYLYCRSGRRSATATGALEEAGYTNIVDLGGFRDAAAKFEELTGESTTEE